VNEAALGGMEDGMAGKDVAEAADQQLGEKFAQATLQADGPHVSHAQDHIFWFICFFSLGTLCSSKLRYKPEAATKPTSS
jgi:hypothetical protein